jgi:N-acylglucosamine 2-epimerase
MTHNQIPARAELEALRKRYESELFESVIPFWLKHSIDRKNGGFYNCLDRDGTIYDTTKHMWLQGRQIWMFSKLSREASHLGECAALARSGLEFMRSHAVRDDGRVYFSLTAEGHPLSMQRKIFSECFFIMALAECSRATGEAKYLEEARQEFARVWEWAFDWRKVGRPAYAGETQRQNLAVPMILLNLIEELTGGEPSEVARYRVEIDECMRRMMLHVHVDKQTVFENVAPDGAFIDTPEGRHLNPGHAIEAGWFLQHWARRLGRTDLSRTATELVRWSHDRGWDANFGGILYFLDYKGFSPTQLEWNMKLWWPHCEALYAHLLNFSITGDAADWSRFRAVHDYAFSHFVDGEQGEWYGYLDRRGEVTHRFKGGPYKGCFHVPRALWLCWRLLNTMTREV